MPRVFSYDRRLMNPKILLVDQAKKEYLLFMGLPARPFYDFISLQDTSNGQLLDYFALSTV